MKEKKEQLLIEQILKLKNLNTNEVAFYLRRSPGAIRNLVLRRAIPHHRPGGRLTYIKDEIDAWVRNS